MVFNTKLTTAMVLATLIAGCAPQVPDSGAGVGFTDYSTYEQQRLEREAGLRGLTLPPAGTISTERPVAIAQQPGGIAPQPGALADPRAIAEAALAVDQPRLIGGPDNAGISDEQDFDAVSGRESIESDAARIAENRNRYEQVQPTALPQRNNSGRPNIVDFALATNNPVGQSLYRRTNILAESRFNRNCARFASSDLAQESFLASGGPERDRTGLDPDGDGFACYWDPAPFRNARTGLIATTE